MGVKRAERSLHAEAALSRAAHALLLCLRRLVGDRFGRARGTPLYPAGPTATRLRDEVAKQRRVPGIVFADGPAGRRARIAGTGIDVFEIASTDRAVGADRARLRAVYDWLSSAQIDAALAYATAFPDEIAQRLAQEEALENRYDRARPAR